jgi:signal transduction histidine kinase
MVTAETPSLAAAAASRRSRRLLWLWMLLAWLPVGGLFVAVLLAGHQKISWHSAVLLALRMLVTAAALGLAVQALTERLRWPHPFHLWFVLVHLAAAIVYAAAWVLLNSLVVSLLHRRLVLDAGPLLGPYLVLGVWIYVMVAGVSYAARATERAARAEAIAARSQLAALRAQLDPHFLFNALHTVVQLIPREPKLAAQAAERLAGLLRTSIEEDRDLVPLASEWSFVERYLDIERIRFGDRLRVHVEIPPAAQGALVPSFALQSLVENAVRHGAAPRVEPTDLTVTAAAIDGRLTLRVADSGAGATPAQVEGGGTGLRRLRERLDALYGSRGRLEVVTAPGAGFTATLVLPQERERP